MPFKNLFSHRFSANGRYVKDLNVRSYESAGGKKFFIDIRLKFINDEGVEFFTKKGVTLEPKELSTFLSSWVIGQPTDKCNLTGDYYTFRNVSFTPLEDKPYLFQLRVEKRNGESTPTKESSIILTQKELKEIDSIKLDIFKSIEM